MSSRSSREHVVAKSAVLQLLTKLVSLGSRANIGRAEPPVARFGSRSATKTINRAFEVIELGLHTLLHSIAIRASPAISLFSLC